MNVLNEIAVPVIQMDLSPLYFITRVFTVVSSGDAQGSTECDRQTFSPVDCPASSDEEETNNEDNDAIGNIEE